MRRNIPSLSVTFLLCFFLPVFTVFPQKLPDSVSKKIDALFTIWNAPGSPGCAIGIVRNDSLIYTKGYGLANLEYQVPITPETIFHTASVSKQFAAYAIVLLARQGKLELDDDIHKFLPWFPDLKEKITIRHLLNHTSGIRDQWQLLAISGTRLDDVITQEQIIKVLSKQQALNFKPGENWSYSNSGFTMIAEIVKSVTGQSLRKFTDSAIFKPLGMNNTHFHDDYTEIVKNRAYSYYRKGNAGFANSILSYSNAGATSLFTNINDMSKWIMNFYQPKAGTLKDIEQLVQKGKLNSGKELTYALGISVSTYKGWRQYAHSGGDAGYRTYITAFPDLKMGFIVFSNLGDFNPVGKTYELADLFIKDKINKGNAGVAITDTAMPILTDVSSVKNNAGHYLSDAGVQFSFPLRDRKLYWDRYGRSDVLVRTKNDTFFVASTPEVKFVFNTKGRDTVVQQVWPDGERLLVKYIPAGNQTDRQLQAYTGIYYCPELDTKFGIVLKDHELFLTNNKYDDIKLRVISKDDLVTDVWWMSHLKMLRDNQNQITGFEVNDARIMHLRFNKVK